MINKFRILYVNGGLMDLGGISSYMINYAKYLYRAGIIVDFVVHGDGIGLKDDELKEIGSIIYHVPIKSKNYIGNIKALRKIFNSKKYNIVHSHMDAGNMVVLREAKRCGVPIRISHSHNTQHITNSKIKLIFNNYAKKKIVKYSTHLFACSKEAGEWLYGKNYVRTGKVQIIHNAIELDKYLFDEETRYKIRNNLGLNDCFVIGHVGRFDYQKNHIFIIKLFSEISRVKPNAKLLLIGDGILRNDVEKLAIKKGVIDKIIFLGAINDVAAYYNAMDIFILPSLFEGLGIVLIEAQTNGLKCVVSDRVPEEANPTKNVKFLNLSSDIKDWVHNIVLSFERNNKSIKYMIDYDIEIQSKLLVDIYIKMEESAIWK